MIVGLFVAHDLWTLLTPDPLTLTSGTDGVHMAGSRHYRGYALDLRKPLKYYKPTDNVEKLAIALRVALGNEFDVVLEKTHIHVEYDPAISTHGAKAPT